MLTTITIKPVRYIPFKTRVFKSTVWTICFFDMLELAFLLIGYQKGITKYMIIGFPLLWIAFAPIFILSVVWVLDSVTLDRIRKTLQVKVRRFDKIIIKKEQTINEGLKIITNASYISYAGKPLVTVFVPARLLIKRDWKIVWVQYTGVYNITDCWTSQLFNQIKVETKKIREAPEMVINYNETPLNSSETSL